MRSYYIRIALRNLFRNKVYSIVNITGLALGITAFLLILEYVSFERSYNGFHKDRAITYRLLNESKKGDMWPEIEPTWAVKAKDRFPEIIDFCRFEQGLAKGVVKRATLQAEPFRESDIGYADGNFFRFFQFELKKGDAGAFNSPNTVFISSAMAKKYFGDEDPISQQLILSNQYGNSNYIVKGIFNIPENSDIHYEMLFSLETLANNANIDDNLYTNVFFKLAPNTATTSLETKLTQLLNELDKENDGVRLRLQPFAYLHLGRSLNDPFQTAGNLKYVYILSLVAFLILLIAWFNYINLSTAQAMKRANEVGVRKIVGASRWSLMQQFLGEALLVNAIALVSAIGIVYLLQPFFNSVMGKNMELRSILGSGSWLLGLTLLVVGSLLSGMYTAFVLSNFNPIETLKNKINRSAKGGLLRKSLVVSQFAISIALILSTLLIFQQISYMQQQKLGYTSKQMLVIRGADVGKDSTYNSREKAFLENVARQSFVQEYAASGTYPGGWYNFMTAGFTQPGSKPGDEFKSYAFAIISERYLPAYEIPLAAGRNFTAAETNVEWNENSKVLLNEKAVEAFGFHSAEEALHTAIQWDERKLQIIGVVKNYNHANLKRSIDPLIFYPQNSGAYISLRMGTDHIRQQLASLEKSYKGFFPGNPFEYFFVDENFNKQYAEEKQYGQLFTAASIWAVVIACLGLFGLTTFTVESRTKEIGIRKVLGASVTDITSLLSADFLKLVLLAALISFPIAWWAMKHWLQDFAYQVPINWWTFVLAGAAAMLVALLTIGFQAVKAALSNPVKNLRTE